MHILKHHHEPGHIGKRDRFWQWLGYEMPPSALHCLAAASMKTSMLGNTHNSIGITESPISVDDLCDNGLPAIPGDDWESFFKDLHIWKAKVPGERLTDIMKKIRFAVEKSESFSNFIPDSPFPLRTFVSALTNATQYIVIAATAKKDTIDFAEKVVEEMMEISLRLQDGGFSQDKLREVWLDLEPKRQLVNEVCEWARKRVISMFRGNTSPENDIQDFWNKLDKARQMFIERSTIGILQGIAQIIENQDRAAQLHRIRRKFSEDPSLPWRAPQRLHAAHCSSDTRKDIIGRILKWSAGEDEVDKRCFHIVGAPGTGKTTLLSMLLAKVSQESQDRLCAEYFIRRSVGSSAIPGNLFPSIALQLSEKSKEAAELVERCDREHTHTFGDEQAKQLFIMPMTAIASKDCSRPIVVIIDALDELYVGEYESLFRTLFRAISSLPANVKVIVSSRPHSAIISCTQSPEMTNSIIQHQLRPEDSTEDVRRYILRYFMDITKGRPDKDWASWPTSDQIESLCNQASGLFAWAAAAMSLVHTRITERGTAHRDEFLSDVGKQRMDVLDNLYSLVLADFCSKKLSLEELHWRLGTIGFLIVAQEDVTIGTIRALFEVSDECFDILSFFEQARSIFISDTAVITSNTVPRMHPTFIAFLTSDRTESHCKILLTDHHAKAAKACLQAINSCGNTAMTKHSTHIIYARQWLQKHSELGGISLTSTSGLRTSESRPANLPQSFHHWVHHPFGHCQQSADTTQHSESCLLELQKVLDRSQTSKYDAH